MTKDRSDGLRVRGVGGAPHDDMGGIGEKRIPFSEAASRASTRARSLGIPARFPQEVLARRALELGGRLEDLLHTILGALAHGSAASPSRSSESRSQPRAKVHSRRTLRSESSTANATSGSASPA